VEEGEGVGVQEDALQTWRRGKEGGGERERKEGERGGERRAA